MSPLFRDLTGEKFGRLSVLRRGTSDPNHNGARWICLCDCGNETLVTSWRLTAGRTKSCGCIGRLSAHRVRHGHARNGKQTRIYWIWLDMIERCERPRHAAFADYGGRGIKVCTRWRQDFRTFLADVGERPSPQHTLDRRNVDGDYEPDNVRWATRKEQARNKRNNLIVVFRGRAMSLAEAVEISGVNYHTAYNRLHDGCSVEEALRPGRRRRKRTGPPTATMAALGRAALAAGLTIAEIEEIGRRRMKGAA